MPHWIKESEIAGNQFGKCASCGALIDLKNDIYPVNPTNFAKRSVNGSYIFFSGIVVVVDEDIEAYMNGTLIFFDADDLPTTQ